jgi:hypothetical protein
MGHQFPCHITLRPRPKVPTGETVMPVGFGFLFQSMRGVVGAKHVDDALMDAVPDF